MIPTRTVISSIYGYLFPWTLTLLAWAGPDFFLGGGGGGGGEGGSNHYLGGLKSLEQNLQTK